MISLFNVVFFFNDTATTEIYTLSPTRRSSDLTPLIRLFLLVLILLLMPTLNFLPVWFALSLLRFRLRLKANQDRKSGSAGMPRPISYAVFCLKKKKKWEIFVGWGLRWLKQLAGIERMGDGEKHH